MNHRVMALPYLMYLASIGTFPSLLQAYGDPLTNLIDIATGIVNIYYDTGTRFNTATGGRINASYYSICLSLNILLTLMIVVHLIMHIRNLRRATGEGSNGLHTAATTVVTMLIESYALYAVALLLFIVPSISKTVFFQKWERPPKWQKWPELRPQVVRQQKVAKSGQK